MPLQKISKILLKVFGSRNERLIKAYSAIAEDAAHFEENTKQLSDEQLKQKTSEFKVAIKSGIDPANILPEAFAIVREAARRNVQMRHFDVQLIGGNILYEGKIAEMATGEGKTLVATLAAYLVHITGRHIHVVTVNDYLAKRDAEWMQPVYEALGLTVGAIQGNMDSAGEERKNQYECDITYGTNNEFGFDYLRDNMKTSLHQMVQSNLEYAIIDEVDSILIDEARTPLIISGPAFDDVTRYKKSDQVSRQLMSLQSSYDRVKKQIDTAERTIANAQGEISEAKKEKNSSRIQKAQKVLEENQSKFHNAQERLLDQTQYYEVEYDKKAVHLTHEGIGAAQEIAGIGSFFTGSNMEWPHLLEQALRAHITFEKEKDYVVMDGKVVIVDEFTGRLMDGRQWSDGLHQAVEAKETVTVKEESQTLATITLQNFFKLYGQISGMTGTAATESEEFMKIYGLEVAIIPTNEPCVRDDCNDLIYKSMKEKFDAIVEDINEISGSGRSVLVGTVSIEKSEAISAALQKKYGIEHEVLNAKQHAREAQIVQKAGQHHTERDGTKRGNVTIATNMAGRGTDIKLGDDVKKLGGLHILGTERHESRRIDNQLRGRAGRQGDKGSSQFFLSFEDDLLSLFSPELMLKALSWVGWEEGQSIYHPRISKMIEKTQKKVEERNYEVRKSLLEYDEVMDYQRKIFYSRRRHILTGKGLKEIIDEMILDSIEKNCRLMLNENYHIECIIEWAQTNFGADLRTSDIANHDVDEIEKTIKRHTKENAANNISISIGEYLEDYQDPQTWDTTGLCKWAMSSFSVNINPGKVKSMSPEDIESQIISAAAEQIDKKDCSQLMEFLKDNFAAKTLATWAQNKFDIKLDTEQVTSLKTEQVKELIKEKTTAKYQQRQIEYPVEFAMNMVFGPQGENVYGFESLCDWVKKKYNADISPDDVQNKKPSQIHDELFQLSKAYNNGQLEEEINTKTEKLTANEIIEWANQRFDTSLSLEQISEEESLDAKVLEAGKEFIRKELADLEKYVLLQVYDGSWKDHLYTMDHLK
ncbi:MAG: preprotein translocase subunit SecA, partial [Phycisphaerae bacterium]|nr:preprotein translocase subunit SecA [Phycisphaerae bacterium]